MSAKPHSTRFESIQEPLDDEERELMDPETWDWENAYEIGPRPDPHLIFHVRLSGDDLADIERAAMAKEMHIGAFLRYAGLEYARGKTPRKLLAGD